MRLPKRSKRAVLQLLFELADLGADGRLGAVAGLRGFREAFQPHDFEERVELVKIHATPAAGTAPRHQLAASKKT